MGERNIRGNKEKIMSRNNKAANGAENKIGEAENQEQTSKRVKLWRRLLCCAGILSLVYFIGLWVYLGAVYLFQWFWLALAAVLLAVAAALPRWHGLPKWFRVLWKTGIVLGMALFIGVEGLVVSSMLDKPEPGADYVIVLGAKVNGTTPSLALQYRIEAARDYLKENPEAKVIASGGQGKNEGISEALAIANSLLSMGVSEDRILMEDKSTSTNENLVFSKACIESLGDTAEAASVVLVSSNFHIFRAKAIARNYGYEKVEGKSAASVPWLQPNYCVREFFAILNDAVKGNLKL